MKNDSVTTISNNLTISNNQTTGQNQSVSSNSTSLLDLGQLNGSDVFINQTNGTPTNYLQNASEISATPIKGGLITETNTSYGVRTVIWQGQEEERVIKQFNSSQATAGCPLEVLGNTKSNLRIQYFWAATCPWCARFDLYFPQLLQETGSNFYIEKYDVFKCTNELAHYEVTSTPTFIFNNGVNESKALYVIGFRTKEEFSQLICKYSGVC